MADSLEVLKTLPRLSAETVKQYCEQQNPEWTKTKFYSVYNRTVKTLTPSRMEHIRNILALEAEVAKAHQKRQKEILRETAGAVNLVKQLQQN